MGVKNYTPTQATLEVYIYKYTNLYLEMQPNK